MKTIYAFDFDGTLTTRDTLIEFIRYARGNSALIMGIIRHLPMLIMMKLRIYPNDKAKQHIFDHFFKGMTVDEFTTICTEFARNSQQLLRPHGIETVFSFRDLPGNRRFLLRHVVIVAPGNPFV